MKEKIIRVLMLNMVLVSLMGCSEKVELESVKEEDTNYLQICTEKEYLTNGTLSPVIEQFKELFPTVEVKIEELPSASDGSTEVIAERNAMIERIQAEVMAGKGPDIFLLTSGRTYLSGSSENLFEDIEKNSRAGIFYDLNLLIEQNKEWDENNFYSGVVEACQVDGKQYIFPLNMQVPMLLTTDENLKTISFNKSKARSNMEGLLEEIEKCIPEEEQGWLATAYYTWLSYPLLNYNTGEVNIGENEEKFFEWSKNIGNLNERYCDPYIYSTQSGYKMQAEKVAKGDIPVLLGYVNGYGGIVQVARMLSDRGQDAVFLPVPDEKGGVTVHIGSYVAINANSQNKKNGYEFLKLIVSEEMMKNGNCPEGWDPPIRKGKEILELVLNQRVVASNEMGSLSPKSMDSLISAMEEISNATIQQIWYIPIEGEKTFNDMAIEYRTGVISYSDFVDKVKEGLKFYWGE